MKEKKRAAQVFLGGVITCFLVCLMVVPGFAATVAKTITVYTGITLYYDGVEVTPKDAGGNRVEPFLYKGTTYLPVRAVSDLLGVDIHWDGATQSVYLGDMPGKVTYLGSDLKPYYSAYYEAPASFAMDGTTYRNGFMLSANVGGKAIFNLDGQYSWLEFDLGHPERYPMYEKKALIYLDGALVEVLEVEPYEMVRHVKIPLRGAAQLIIGAEGNANLGFANVAVS